MEDLDIKRWHVISAVVFVIVWVSLIVIYRQRLYHDLYPFDQGVAANIMASFIIFSAGLIAGVFLWPPTRRAIHRFVDRKIDVVQNVVKTTHDEAMQERDLMHKKLDHMIKHIRAVPEFDPDK